MGQVLGKGVQQHVKKNPHALDYKKNLEECFALNSGHIR